MPTNRSQHLGAVARLAGVLVALAAAVTLTPVAAAGPDAAKQRVAITTKGRVAFTPQGVSPSGVGEFVLTAMQLGVLKRDSGTESAVWSEPSFVRREGQTVEITDGVETLKGKRGSITIRFRIEWVFAGHVYHVGTGTWNVVRGTGDYSQITGGGRSGHVWLDRGPWSGRNVGFLTPP